MSKVTKNLILELTAIVMLVTSIWIKDKSAGAVVNLVASLMIVNVAMNFLNERPGGKKALWIITLVLFLLNVALELLKLCLGWF